MLPVEWREMRRFGFSWPLLRYFVLRLFQSRSFRKADGLIFLTQYVCDTVTSLVGRRKGKLAVIPHGIDERFFCEPRLQCAVGNYSQERPLRLFYVSIVNLYKHQWHVARAVASLRASGYPVTLDLVGPAYGTALRRLEATLRDVDPKGEFIVYHGAVPYENLPKFYKNADIDVFASSCENMPIILLEGMAAGIPIACSRREPMPEILGEAGVYFDPEDPKEIAAAIRVLIESPELRAQKAQAAYARAQQFSWRRCAAETFSFLSEVFRSYSGQHASPGFD